MPFAQPAPLVINTWAPTALILLACASLCGCGPQVHRGAGGGADQTPRTASGDDGAEAGYVTPPRIVSVARSPIALTLMGNAAPDAQVELMAPEGETMTVKTNPAGAWRLTMPAVARPRMFALLARLNATGPNATGPNATGPDDRLVHSEGALILIPRSGPPALLVRAGAGALVFAAKTIRPTLDALDYDPGGFSAAAGRARPGASVRLMMDGQLAGVGQADAGGRYAILAANRRLPFGTHTALVQSADGQDERGFTISPPGPTLTTPYKVDPIPNGWRLEWAIPGPGGGIQTTLVFIPAG
jgi:hypothetical protein